MAQTLTIPVQNMTCGGCAARVQKALVGVMGAQEVSVNLADETAQVTVDAPETLGDALGALTLAGYPAQSTEMRLSLSGMSCASCVGRVERAFLARAGVVSAQVNLADESAVVRVARGVISASDLLDIAADAGYPAKIAGQDSAQDHATRKDDEAHESWRAMLWAAALTLPVFVLEMGGHMVPAFHHWIMATLGMTLSWTVQFVLTTLVLFGPGRGFLTKGFPALWRGAPTMDSLVALGAGSAWAFSTVVLLAPDVLPQDSRVVYFEAAAVIVTLILLGRWFEARAKGQTGAAIRALVGLQPKFALVRDGSEWIEQPIDDLQVGQEFLLKPGARIPADAVVVMGEGRVDESMITGEPMQVAKAPGDALTGGSVNGTVSLICEVTRTGQDTTLAQIIRMVQQAQGARLPIQALVDRVTLWFVPVVMLIAAATVAIWLIFGAGLSQALVVGVSVLIIACPCAMGLATPTSIMVGTGRAATLGVLFRQGDALQSLNGVRVVAFDKTGTLTEGRPSLTTFACQPGFDADETLAMIASAERYSEHPLAQAILDAADEKGLPLREDIAVQTQVGEGINATLGDAKTHIGNRRLMTRHGIDLASVEAEASALEAQGQTVIFAAQDGALAVLLAVSDPIRPSSAAALVALRARGLHIALITGDAEKTAQAVAKELQIDTVIAGVLPEGKRAALQELRTTHGSTAFVGDGINDAPVLAEADVGIAIGTGTDVAIESADVVLMSEDLNAVTRAFDISARTLRNIKQNLCWAFGYNTALIPVAAGVLYPAFGVLLSPGLAAGAMAFSSVFVLGNALRLRRAGGTP